MLISGRIDQNLTCLDMKNFHPQLSKVADKTVPNTLKCGIQWFSVPKENNCHEQIISCRIHIFNISLSDKTYSEN